MKGGLRDDSLRLHQLDSALGSMRRQDVMRARFRQLVGAASPCLTPVNMHSCGMAPSVYVCV